ncbi:MAG: sucrose-phosphate phosphatase [Scytolyngbya sp. HA4215-MV1]|nr:sucrose-phosphate phosphatase [Scytolyngbya sp. HA4215-MV1]
MKKFLLVTDLDNTLVGDDLALAKLNQCLIQHREQYNTQIVYATGRSLTLYHELATEKSLLAPDALITSVGTEIYLEGSKTPDQAWSDKLSSNWNLEQIIAITNHFADLVPQPESEQGAFKASYFLTPESAKSTLPQLKQQLQAQGLEAKLIYSSSQDLDILPTQADKGMAMTFLRQNWQIEPTCTVACGDSGNDLALFQSGLECGIIVGNAQPELLQWHYMNPNSNRYLAIAHCAGGILEGLEHFDFL